MKSHRNIPPQPPKPPKPADPSFPLETTKQGMFTRDYLQQLMENVESNIGSEGKRLIEGGGLTNEGADKMVKFVQNWKNGTSVRDEGMLQIARAASCMNNAVQERVQVARLEGKSISYQEAIDEMRTCIDVESYNGFKAEPPSRGFTEEEIAYSNKRSTELMVGLAVAAKQAEQPILRLPDSSDDDKVPSPRPTATVTHFGNSRQQRRWAQRRIRRKEEKAQREAELDLQKSEYAVRRCNAGMAPVDTKEKNRRNNQQSGGSASRPFRPDLCMGVEDTWAHFFAKLKRLTMRRRASIARRLLKQEKFDDEATAQNAEESRRRAEIRAQCEAERAARTEKPYTRPGRSGPPVDVTTRTESLSLSDESKRKGVKAEKLEKMHEHEALKREKEQLRIEQEEKKLEALRKANEIMYG